MQPHHQAVLDLARQFKPPHVSDVDALLNVIDHHAATIKQQQAKIDKLEAAIMRLKAVLDEVKA